MAKEKDQKTEVLKMDSDTFKLVNDLNKNIHQMNKLDPKKELLRGILSGVGVVIGSTVIVGLAILILRQFTTAPIIGNAINDIVNSVDRK